PGKREQSQAKLPGSVLLYVPFPAHILENKTLIPTECIERPACGLIRRRERYERSPHAKLTFCLDYAKESCICPSLLYNMVNKSQSQNTLKGGAAKQMEVAANGQ
ncbi:hypothetical protein, partial [Alicyclobacillus hesperidum]|uniref:hypothetical protein n=1 Tax=Alicyclobacillus hesperidum TaxID=89784 RepID=UPI0005901F0A